MAGAFASRNDRKRTPLPSESRNQIDRMTSTTRRLWDQYASCLWSFDGGELMRTHVRRGREAAIVADEDPP